MTDQRGSATLIGIIIIIVVFLGTIGALFYFGIIKYPFEQNLPSDSVPPPKTNSNEIPIPSGSSLPTEPQQAPAPQSTSSPTKTPDPNYLNPFEASDYQNPFADTENPFKNL